MSRNRRFLRSSRAPTALVAACLLATACNQLTRATGLSSPGQPQIAEVEINPLLVLERGVLGLDARLVRPSTDPETR